MATFPSVRTAQSIFFTCARGGAEGVRERWREGEREIKRVRERERGREKVVARREVGGRKPP